MKSTKHIMKNWRQYSKKVEKELRSYEKRNSSLIEGQIKNVSRLRKGILSEAKEFLKEDFDKHQNDIYISTLNEVTGEKTYIPRNFDEILTEAENDKTKAKDDLTRYDHVFEMLGESIDYERSLYFNENKEQVDEYLVEVDWEKRGAEVEAGEIETDKYDIEGKSKSMVTRTKEAWQKGKIYFFLKTVDFGLKAALKASRSILGLISGLVMKVATKSISAWAAAKVTTSQVWENIKKFATEKLGVYIKKLIKPFFWIASKLSKDVEKQKLYVPILVSITISCAMIALLYAFGAFDIFGKTVDGAAEGMDASSKILADANPDWVGAMCEAGAPMISEGLLREESLEDCGMIMQNGKKLTHQQTKEVLEHLVREIKKDIGNTMAFTQFSSEEASQAVGAAAKEASSEFSYGYAGEVAQSAVVDRQIAGLEMMLQKLDGIGDSVLGQAGEAIDLRDNGIPLIINNELQKAALATAGGMKDGVYEAAMAAGGEEAKKAAAEELKAYANNVIFTYSIESVTEIIQEEGAKAGVDYTKESIIAISQQQVTAITDLGLGHALRSAGGRATAEIGVVAKTAVKENILTNKEILRFKKLGGLV